MPASASMVADRTVVKVGNGSGVIVGRSGNDYYILTNAHVVGAFNNQESVVLPDGRAVEGVVVKNNRWYDFDSKGDDLAIVRVRSSAVLSVAPVGGGELKPGDAVLQAGFPLRADRDAFLLSKRSTGLYAKTAFVSEDRDAGDRDPGRRLQGSHEIGLTGVLPVGSSGGGTFDVHGRLVGLNGRSSNGLPMPTQGGPPARPSAGTAGYIIDTQTLRDFMRGAVPGY